MGREDQKIYFKNRNMRHNLHILCCNSAQIEFLFLALDSIGKMVAERTSERRQFEKSDSGRIDSSQPRAAARGVQSTQANTVEDCPVSPTTAWLAFRLSQGVQVVTKRFDR